MAVADHGGWDLAVEIAANALSAAVSSAFPSRVPPRQVATPLFQARVTPKATISGVTLNATADLTTSSVRPDRLYRSRLSQPVTSVRRGVRQYGSRAPGRFARSAPDAALAPATRSGAACAGQIADDVTIVGILDDFVAMPACAVCLTCAGEA